MSGDEKKSKKAKKSDADAPDEVFTKEKKHKDKKRKHDTVDNGDTEVEVAVADQSEETFEDDAAAAERKRLKKEAKKAKKRAEKEKEGKDVISSSSTSAPVSAISSNISPEEVAAFRSEHGISVHPDEDATLYKPFTQFSTLLPITAGPCPYVNKYLGVKNFKTPSPIQAQCWPPLLAGRDVIGIAATGSGKTLAFLIPGMLKLSNNAAVKASGPKGKPCPGMLVMAPTRELAMQSFQVVQEVGGMKGVCIFGGVPKDVQKADLRAGAEIVIATPGRLLDLIEENVLTLQSKKPF